MHKTPKGLHHHRGQGNRSLSPLGLDILGTGMIGKILKQAGTSNVSSVVVKIYVTTRDRWSAQHFRGDREIVSGKNRKERDALKLMIT